MLLTRSRSQLIVSDVQERLVPAVPEADRVVARVRVLLAAAVRLDVPVTVTEHYPQGLGPTLPALLDELPETSAVLPKTTFSSLNAPAIAKRIRSLYEGGRDQVVIAGLEAHVCVLQTSLALRGESIEVFVVADAVASRSAHDQSAATARLLHAGCHWVTTEMAVFEWLERGGTDEFRALLPLLR